MENWNESSNILPEEKGRYQVLDPDYIDQDGSTIIGKMNFNPKKGGWNIPIIIRGLWSPKFWRPIKK